MREDQRHIPILREEMKRLLADYERLLGLFCFFYDDDGRQLGVYDYDQRAKFCWFISAFDSNQICRQSYRQSCVQSLKSGGPHVYFCPFGLVNLTIPVPLGEGKTDFITAGPFSFTPPDDLMMKNVLDLNPLLQPKARELRLRLSEIDVKSEGQLESLLSIMSKSIAGLAGALVPAAREPDHTSDLEQLLQELEQKIAGLLCHDDDNKYYSLQKEMELLSQNMVDGLSKGVLEALVERFMEDIYEDNVFYLVHCRVLKYLRVLLLLTVKARVNPDLIFSSSCQDIRAVLAAEDLETLSSRLGIVNDRFIECYLPGKSLANKAILFRIMHYIRGHYQDISLQDVANEVGFSPAYLSNLFKKETGRSYSSYLNKVRVEESKRLLRQSASLSEIAQRVGFSDQSYYTNVFRKYEGISPNKWRNLYHD